jgi:hypothetical protein
MSGDMFGCPTRGLCCQNQMVVARVDKYILQCSGQSCKEKKKKPTNHLAHHFNSGEVEKSCSIMASPSLR